MIDLPTDFTQQVGKLARRGSEGRRNEWEAIEAAVRELVAPAVASAGLHAVVEALTAAKHDPYIAAVIVAISGSGRSADHRGIHVTDVFSDDEIVAGALAYLEASPDAALEDSRWAWTTLWNLWGQIEPSAQARLIAKVIEQVAWNDRMLWMIGDGPLSALADNPSDLEPLESCAAIGGKVARIWKLVEVDWPHGGVDV